ncbi:zinc finger BED domain-containing protein RICESLEEPER 2-like protein [Tanacetum coccineum]
MLGDAFSLACIIEARFEAIAKKKKEQIIKGSLNDDEDIGVDEVSSAIDGVFDMGESNVESMDVHSKFREFLDNKKSVEEVVGVGEALEVGEDDDSGNAATGRGDDVVKIGDISILNSLIGYGSPRSLQLCRTIGTTDVQVLIDKEVDKEVQYNVYTLHVLIPFLKRLNDQYIKKKKMKAAMQRRLWDPGIKKKKIRHHLNGKGSNTTLRNHITHPHCEAIKAQQNQNPASGQTSMARDGSVFRYNPNYLREQFAGLVIQRALPFNHFDHEQTTRVFQNTMQPRYTHVSRSTLKRDAMKLWLAAKQEIIDSFGNINACVNLTTDVWSAPHGVPVASESEFSTSGRVLSIRRTRLTPASLEMCMCLTDHLDAKERKQDASSEGTLSPGGPLLNYDDGSEADRIIDEY